MWDKGGIMGKLTVLKARSISEPGRYADGGTLYLVVAPGGSKSWVQRLVVNGKRTDIGLGGFPLVTLAEARDQAFENRRLARRGGDPLGEKRKAGIPTFKEAAQQTHEANLSRWRNGKHTVSWMQTLERHAMPRLGAMPVDRIGREDVLATLTPIWSSHPETARRVRQRIRAVLSWCQAHGYVENNAAGERIDGALPSLPKVKAHQRALHFDEVPAALEVVEGSRASLAAKACFRWMVLTAARSGEARGATWSEVDTEARTWTVSAARMKSGKDHVVPLSGAALAVLEQVRPLRRNESDLIFPSPLKKGKPLSDMSLVKVCRDLRIEAVPHGFRSSFRTWAAERTNADHATMEMSLAHAVGSAVERSYARSDLLAKRRTLMQRWADYLTGESAKVVELRHG